MIRKFFNHRSKTITFAAGILGLSALVNGLLALFRDRLLAARFGAGEGLDIYFAAFRLPDFIYGILIAGGIIAVFLPIFSEHYNQNKEKGWYFVNTVLNCFLILLIFLCLVLLIFTPFFIRFVAPGFSEEGMAWAVALTRIMLLSPFFFVLSSIFSGVLHYFKRFLIYSTAPLLYNLGIIAGILFFVPLFGLFGLAYGVVLGAFLHLAVQIPPAILTGFRYQPAFNFRSPGLRKFFQLMIPRIIGATSNHINLIIVTAIASTLVSGSIAIFNFSNNLQKFPTILIGVSWAAAAFPTLARAWARGKKDRFLKDLFSIFRQILFLIIPVSFLIFLLRTQLVYLILGTGQFGWPEIRLTAASLGIFSFGIFAFCLIPLLAKVFFSFQNTKIPVTIGVASIGLSIALSFLFVWLLGFSNAFQEFLINFLKLQGIRNIQIIGLPLALSLSGIFNFSLLFIFLHREIQKKLPQARKLLKEKIKETLSSLRKILIAGCFLIILTYYLLQQIAFFVNVQTFSGVFLQTSIAAFSGIFVYILTTFLLGSPELTVIKTSILKQFTKTS